MKGVLGLAVLLGLLLVLPSAASVQCTPDSYGGVCCQSSGPPPLPTTGWMECGGYGTQHVCCGGTTEPCGTAPGGNSVVCDKDIPLELLCPRLGVCSQ